MLSREVGDFTTHPTPHDVNNKQVCDPYRNGLVEDCQKRADRIVACVNACAGMADPAKEIEAMREAIKIVKDLAEWSARYPRGMIYSASNRKMDEELVELEKRATAALTKLQPFIKP